MMQAGSNLILSGISDTTVTSWVSRLWAKLCECYNAVRDTDHICSQALNLVCLKDNKQAKKKVKFINLFNMVRIPPQGKRSDTFTTRTHLL